ncbi:unnamed protein product (macronuclear) [Paramecium tetraurelia]|uniref:Malectin domain-containing protein n=1 Tax=Paramecium tetraurelia TaxID=5888 RepID=A0BN21_PARTE|nr:uncharacterized protein GSPATT00030575001 [Paramecium tetraurelia]CAK59938.1 unnamed protein product [Paramecium tetraurelia]|eukprot:XP_001427336.1 hypothetical protein (macronuclear) [Paramecium tetraurelia strain d4-2]
MQIMLLILLFIQVNSYLDANKIKYAVDAGNQYYYKDRQKILYRYDQNYKGGQQQMFYQKVTSDQNHHLIPLQYLDYYVFQTSRTVSSEQDFFKYSITMRLNGNYTLILCFIESEQRSARFFDIYLEDELIKEQFDIYKEAGGINIPLYFAFEFEFDGKNITANRKTIYQMSDNKLHFDLTFKGKGSSVSAIILYQGKIEDILIDLESALLSKDQIEATFINQIEFIKALKQKAARYAHKQKGKGNENVNTLMNQYLSPFQKLINNFDIGNNVYNEISNGLDPSPLELFLDALLNNILVPLGSVLFQIIDFILDNKILTTILMTNLILYYYCFGNDKTMFANVPVGLVLDPEVDSEMEINYNAQSPKSRHVNVLKSKKKKK